MAKDSSFDIVSETDMQEVNNAISQAMKEIGQRFDFRNSKSDITLEGNDLKVISDDEFKLENVLDIFRSKAIKRNVSVKCFDYGKVEPAAKGTVRQMIKIKSGISKENAKKIINLIKESKLKVQAQIQDDQVRVSGKNKDDLQQVIAKLRQADLEIDLQFINFR
ncbi:MULTISPECIES: YajQ family cyclic di-GMP-binding protein [Anaerosinus]|uniref:Nucleotide-binding protein P3F81_04840 n=1 Tax=Selenobaculum gibii TaxID=3054208 RepID=A0A9Y2AK87_9FIRM|nr:YajQ family cyclic di-GMP-binding protein [Selenobaculum gbiensis]WIW71633.1 YajQ family cyclic di-GMP-binding protein [Selenobaculum gbiensis]